MQIAETGNEKISLGTKEGPGKAQRSRWLSSSIKREGRESMTWTERPLCKGSGLGEGGAVPYG
jgi:hypothetical protein